METRQRVYEAVRLEATELARDCYGNHMVQKVFDSAGAEQKKALVAALQGQVASLSQDQFGCRVIQKAPRKRAYGVSVGRRSTRCRKSRSSRLVRSWRTTWTTASGALEADLLGVSGCFRRFQGLKRPVGRCFRVGLKANSCQEHARQPRDPEVYRANAARLCELHH